MNKSKKDCILDLFSKNDELTIREISQILKIKIDIVRTNINRLMKEGLLGETGERKEKWKVYSTSINQGSFFFPTKPSSKYLSLQIIESLVENSTVNFQDMLELGGKPTNIRRVLSYLERRDLILKNTPDIKKIGKVGFNYSLNINNLHEIVKYYDKSIQEIIPSGLLSLHNGNIRKMNFVQKIMQNDEIKNYLFSILDSIELNSNLIKKEIMKVLIGLSFTVLTSFLIKFYILTNTFKKISIDEMYSECIIKFLADDKKEFINSPIDAIQEEIGRLSDLNFNEPRELYNYLNSFVFY